LAGRVEAAAPTRDFYREYFAVLDVAAELYLETIEQIFMDHHLPDGRLQYRGGVLRPEAIRQTPVLTVEAERDELCPPGQTAAAHGLRCGLPAELQQSYLQPGVGHYGLFAGRRWEQEVYPVVRDFHPFPRLKSGSADRGGAAWRDRFHR
jgi:polyhydroxyalkanoate depolymerase